MSDIREIRCSIEIRADDSRQSPGRITGSLMVYGDKARSRQELFADGALAWPDGGIVLNEQHNRQAPIMRFTPTVEGREVRIDAALPDTQRGRDAAVLVKNGTLTGLSVEFVSENEGYQGGLRIVKRARLTAAALVDNADYGRVEVRRGLGGAGGIKRWR